MKSIKAYSYSRFSSQEQKNGHSLERQTEAAKKYAEKNNLILDDNLKYEDKGISGFKGKNSAVGALKAFIDAVDNNQIGKGSYLIIESLDRLSREKILKALTLLTDILNRGIKIVTLMDEKEYTEESINNPMHLMYSIMIMSTAHEESAKKSERIGKAWEKKRKDAKDFNKPMTRKLPSWMKIQDGKIIAIPERAEIVKKIYLMVLSGKGKATITKYLNRNEIKNWNGSNLWQVSYIQKVLTNKAAYGFLENKDKNLFIEGYYPAVITKSQFLKAQDIRTSKKIPIGRAGNTLSNLFVGLCKCSNCGRSLHFVNKSTKIKPSTQGWTYLICATAKAGSKDCHYFSWQYPKIEKHILYSLREINYEDLFGEDPVRDFVSEILLKQDELKTVNAKIYNIVAVIADTGSSALLDKLTELENTKAILISDIQDLENEKTVDQNKINRADIELIDDFFKDKDNLDLRLKVHQMLKGLISSIVFQVDLYGDYYGFIKIYFNGGSSRNIAIFDKSQKTSASIKTNEGFSYFDTMINITPDGQAIRENITYNDYIIPIPDYAIKEDGTIDLEDFKPADDNYQIKTVDGVMVVIYPEFEKQYNKYGRVTATNTITGKKRGFENLLIELPES